MFRRLFWFAVGAGVAVFASAKIRGYMKKASPEAIGHRVAESASGMSQSARGFVDRDTSRDGRARDGAPRGAQPAR